MRSSWKQRAARLCWVGSLAFLVVVAIPAMRQDFAVAREVWLLSTTGYAALAALFASLAATPLSRLGAFVGRPLPVAAVAALRRALGISAAGFALFHGALAMIGYLDWQWGTVWHWPYLRAGLTALAILILLLATSFPRLVASLKIRLWKPLHRLAYVAAAFLFQHLLLSPFAGERLVLGLFGGLVVVEALRLLPRRTRRTRSAAVR